MSRTLGRCPEEYFGILEYPDADAASVASQWASLTSASRFGCVQSLKAALVRCSRDLAWRAAMAEEVEKLAGEQAAGVRATVSDEQAQATPRLNVLDQVCDPRRRALAVVVYLLSI